MCIQSANPDCGKAVYQIALIVKKYNRLIIRKRKEWSSFYLWVEETEKTKLQCPEIDNKEA
jgi:hypothetical protein